MCSGISGMGSHCQVQLAGSAAEGRRRTHRLHFTRHFCIPCTCGRSALTGSFMHRWVGRASVHLCWTVSGGLELEGRWLTSVFLRHV